MLIKFLGLSSLQRKKNSSQYQHSTRTGQFVMLELIKWAAMGTAKKKEKIIIFLEGHTKVVGKEGNDQLGAGN